MKKWIGLALLSFGIVMVAHAQSGLTGAWEGQTRAGAALMLTLTAKDSTLSGTLTRNGQSTTISDGKVSKNTFTFKATLSEQQESFSGELTGDDIRIWLDRQGPSTAIVLRRSARK